MSCPPAHHLNLRGSAREHRKTTKNNFKNTKEKKDFHYKQIFLGIIRSKIVSITHYFFHWKIDFTGCYFAVFLLFQYLLGISSLLLSPNLPHLIPSVSENTSYNYYFFFA